VQRKQFRIEALLAQPNHAPSDMAEKLTPFVHDAEGRRLARGAADLAAAMEAMEKACGVALGTAERVDENARMLANAAQAENLRALAQDIRAQMARIFEICNFQDVAGQRISSVIKLLTGLDEHLSDVAAPAEPAPATPTLINGPRRDGASGHVTQSEIDSIFALAFD
jgi:chemotaxis protein CheZ